METVLEDAEVRTGRRMTAENRRIILVWNEFDWMQFSFVLIL